MKTSCLILTCCLIVIAALAIYAGKEIATFKLTNTNGFNAWNPNFRCDEKGNIIVYAVERDTTGLVSKVSYEARAKNGKVYSQGSFPDVVGAANVGTAGSVSWANGGFDKGFLLLQVNRGPTLVEYIMYKLGKKGAEKVGSLDFLIDPMVPGNLLVYMYKKKIVVEQYTPPTNFNDQATWEFKFLNYKLKEDTKKGGIIKANNQYWNGKSSAFVTYSPVPVPTNAEIKIFGP